MEENFIEENGWEVKSLMNLGKKCFSSNLQLPPKLKKKVRLRWRMARSVYLWHEIRLFQNTVILYVFGLVLWKNWVREFHFSEMKTSVLSRYFSPLSRLSISFSFFLYATLCNGTSTPAKTIRVSLYFHRCTNSRFRKYVHWDQRSKENSQSVAYDLILLCRPTFS